jgi:hypothetical protein
MAKAKAGPVVTDNGNFVIDAPFEEALYKDPHTLLIQIKMLTGVVEVGLFCGMAKAAYFGNQVLLCPSTRNVLNQKLLGWKCINQTGRRQRRDPPGSRHYEIWRGCG